MYGSLANNKCKSYFLLHFPTQLLTVMSTIEETTLFKFNRQKQQSLSCSHLVALCSEEGARIMEKLDFVFSQKVDKDNPIIKGKVSFSESLPDLSTFHLLAMAFQHDSSYSTGGALHFTTVSIEQGSEYANPNPLFENPETKKCPCLVCGILFDQCLPLYIDQLLWAALDCRDGRLKGTKGIILLHTLFTALKVMTGEPHMVSLGASQSDCKDRMHFYVLDKSYSGIFLPGATKPPTFLYTSADVIIRSKSSSTIIGVAQVVDSFESGISKLAFLICSYFLQNEELLKGVFGLQVVGSGVVQLHLGWVEGNQCMISLIKTYNMNVEAQLKQLCVQLVVLIQNLTNSKQ